MQKLICVSKVERGRQTSLVMLWCHVLFGLHYT